MPTWLPDLGAKPFGAETCKLGATNDDAELRVQILKAYLQGCIYEKLPLGAYL